MALTFGFEEGVAIEAVCAASGIDTNRMTARAIRFTQVLRKRRWGGSSIADSLYKPMSFIAWVKGVFVLDGFPNIGRRGAA